MKNSVSKFVFALFLVAFSVTFAHAQGAEHLKVNESASVLRGTHGSVIDASEVADNLNAYNGTGSLLDEHTRLVKNEVNMTARHCQAYQKSVGIFHKRIVTDVVACEKDASTIYFTHTDYNLRTNAGGDWQASVMGNTSAPPATANYIALSNDATAPSTSDTTLASEITTNGLGRAQGVYAHTNGTSSYTIQKVFSATGTQASQKAGLFNAVSSGTLVFENTYTQVTV